MRRYEIVDELQDNIQGREDISVVDPSIDKRLLFTSTFTRELGIYVYNQDIRLNRYDLNNDILDEIIDKEAYSLLWIIDPKYLTLKTAVKMAQLGGGEYLSEEYKRLWEIAVLRYLAGERDFYNYSDYYTEDRLKSDAEFAQGDLNEYIYNFMSDHDGYSERDKRSYLLEEERKEKEVKTLRKIIKKK